MTAQQPQQQPQRDCSTCIEDRTDNCPAKQFNKFLVQFTGCLFHSSRPHTPAPEQFDAVIKELEARNKEMNRDSPYDRGQMFARSQAITLLRGEKK
jgi:hypothetical protein